MRQHIAFQRIESAVIFIASTYIYFDSGFSVVAYVLLLFAFDVSMEFSGQQVHSFISLEYRSLGVRARESIAASNAWDSVFGGETIAEAVVRTIAPADDDSIGDRAGR